MKDRERRIVIRWRARQTEVLGPTLGQAYPVDDSSGFDDAIKAIDEAEQQIWGDHDSSTETPE